MYTIAAKQLAGAAVADVTDQRPGLMVPAPERPVRIATMNALVRTILLIIIAFLVLVNLVLPAGSSTRPIEKLVLAVPALLLVSAAVRVRRRAS
jgi:hypothetical protein